MKFFILTLFNLLSISSVLSELDHLNKRDVCAFKLQSYDICYLYTSPKNEKEFTKTCQALNEEKCKYLYENGVGIIDECKGEEGPENEFRVKSAHLQKKAVCEKDENGNSCPYKDFIMKNKNISSPTEDDYNELFGTLYNETCKSEICTISTIRAIDAFIIEKVDKTYHGFNFTSEEQEQLKKLDSNEQNFIENLKSYYNHYKEISEKLKKECTSQIVTISDDKLNTSGNENLKYFSIQYTFSALILVLTWWMYILY